MTVAYQPVSTRRWPVLAELLPRTTITSLALVVVGAGLTAVCAQLTFPIPGSPVPVSGQTFAVLMTGAVLGPARGMAAQLLYIGAGALGAPIFASGAHGIEALFGATGGYLAGFALASTVMGWAARRGYDRRIRLHVLAVVAATLIIYFCGATWLAVQLHLDAATAFSVGVVPFLVGDAVKAALASALIPVAWRSVRRVERTADVDDKDPA